MLLDVEHRLVFQYDAYISETFMELRVEPLSDGHQTLRSFFLAVGPPSRPSRYEDWNGNAVHHFGISDFHDRIEVLARSVVETHGAPSPGAAPGAPPPRGALGPLGDFTTFGGPVERSPELERLAADWAAPDAAPLGEQVAALGTLLRERFEYRTDVTDVESTSQHILEEGAGVCQDFAHLALALLRLRGIPCRYVSGYLDVSDHDGPAQSHAWIEVAGGDGGWAGFDPTHDRAPDERYVGVAHGRHYDDVPPSRGVFRGRADEALDVAVRTRVVDRVGVTSQHREIGRIDLPVFRDIPSARRAPLDEPVPAIEQQQQQQQQS